MRARLTMMTAAVIGAAVLGAGCSDGRAATESNFHRALSAYHESRQICLDEFSFPYRLETGSAGYGGKKQLLDTLVSQNLLVVSVGERVDRSFARLRQKVPYRHYNLSASGRDYTQGKKLCFARYRVRDILSYSKPAKRKGTTFSTVQYEYKAGNVATWARDQAIWSRYHLDRVKKASATLVLTKQGWMHEKQARKDS